MSERERINIGAFLGHMDAEYSYEVCMGMEKACRQTDANLFVFPGMFAAAFYSNPQRYDYQINTVYGLVKKENIDVLIISLGTIGMFLYTDDYREFLKQFEGIPVILLEQTLPGYSSISIDNESGFRSCLEHLIHVHHCQKICYVDGRENNPDAISRRQTYIDTMSRYGLPCDATMIFNGNFVQDVTEPVKALICTHPDVDAICFANDDMAKGSYPVLKELGRSIGRDILVTGFDDNPAAPFLEPPLTTVRVNSFSIGFRSVLEAIKLLRKKDIIHKKIPSQFVIRESCGCHNPLDWRIQVPGQEFSLDSLEHTAIVMTNHILEKNPDDQVTAIFQDGLQQLIQFLMDVAQSMPQDDLVISLKQKLLFLEQTTLPQISLERFNDNIRRLIQQLLNIASTDGHRIRLLALESEIYTFTGQYVQGILSRQNSQMKNTTWVLTHIASDALPIVTDTEKCLQFLGEKLQQLKLTDAFLLLYKTPVIYWGKEPYVSTQPLHLAMHMKLDEPVQTYLENPVSVTDILSLNRGNSESRCTRYVFPVFANEELFGYLICKMDQSMFHFMNIASREIGLTVKLMHLMRREKEYREQLLQANKELTERSQIDVLTNIYNRRGFLENGVSAIRENYGKHAIIAYLDLDSLKQINDQFGHENGDYAIATAAEILKHSCRKQDIIARIGGDEFALLSILSEDTIDPETIRQRIFARMNQTNETSGKPFYIELSMGIMKFQCLDQSIEALLGQVDDLLYANKQQKRCSVAKFQE